MALTELQKKTAQAIVNVFETGRVMGDYGRVIYLPSDPGQLTYGRSQTTLASGNLYLLIAAYCASPGASRGDALRPYLERLAEKDAVLNTNLDLRANLKAAGSDPVMQSCQDSFFDRNFWFPAVNAATKLGLTEPLSVGVVYDSFIHGAWKAMRDRTLAKVATPADDPRGWTQAYVATRRNWLATNAKPILQKCVYRMDAFRVLMDQDAWSLGLPLTVRRQSITAALLEGDPVALSPTSPAAEVETASAAEDDARLLRLTSPMMVGPDVRAMQEKLGIGADGIFGGDTQKAVKAYQSSHGLVADGVVGPATRAAMGL